jgi:hypothetical protein
MWIMDKHHVPHLPDCRNKCLDMTTAVIHVQLYMKPLTTQSLLDVAVAE